jgi:SAM-dependent methyltransferase
MDPFTGMNSSSPGIEPMRAASRPVSTSSRAGNAAVFDPTTRRPKILVAIASYGNRQIEFLKKIIRNYQDMPMEVDVVVVSDAPKDLGSAVTVKVGLPSKNPWSLPFAHKAVFAERVDHYDLFVYSEDDIGVNAGHIRAFLNATAQLESDEIAGFLRYEIDPSGKWLLTEPWGHYHWKPESVKRRGAYTVAEFTNEHAGFYLLTQSQLKRAIASGGFLRDPCTGRYGLPETAATDPYTNCGFRKVICISALQDFLVHHLPNRYANGLPVSLASFQQQVQTLMKISDGTHPARTLCEVESRSWPSRWQKSYYEKPGNEWLKRVPADATEILSIGCGWGALEEKLTERGAKVTALPLDSVIGAEAARRGIEVVYGTLDECFRTLEGRSFGCVLLMNLLHLQPDPGWLIGQCARRVREGGALVLGGPNFHRLPWFLKRHFGIGEFRKLRSFDRGGISICGPGTLAKDIRNGGLRIAAVEWLNHSSDPGRQRGCGIPLGRFTAKEWVLQARR